MNNTSIGRSTINQKKGNYMIALRKPLGTILLAGVFLSASLAGIVAFLATWPRNSNTSPLLALLALAWSCAWIVTSVLMWRRSRFAGLVFIAAIGLILLPARFIVPSGQIFLPSFVVIIPVALLGYWYLRRVSQAD